MILINIKMQIRPEKMDDWLALADSYAKDVNSEDGCLFFQFSRSLTNDNEFVCIEGFKDAEAGATHVKHPYVKKFFDTAPDLVATQPQIIYIDTPHDGFGPMGEIQPRLPAKTAASAPGQPVPRHGLLREFSDAAPTPGWPRRAVSRQC
jgi:quinol monooxygenase YgiN